MTKQATLTLMVGGPGSGKSTVVRQRYSGATVVDMDEIKKAHPDYDPKNPSAVHLYSQQVAIRMAYHFIGAAQSFVYDSTGTNVERLLSFISAAKSTGMRVEAVLVTCSVETALDRNRKRARTVPEDMLREKHSMVAEAWSSIRALVDSAVVVENE